MKDTGRAWAYIGAVLGATVSIAANIAHSYVPPAAAPTNWQPHAGAVIGAVFWPVALLVAVEIISRVFWPDGVLNLPDNAREDGSNPDCYGVHADVFTSAIDGTTETAHSVVVKTRGPKFTNIYGSVSSKVSKSGQWNTCWLG